jgi:hypothetical protein
MSDVQIFEVEIRATDASGSTATKHLEYRASGSTPDHAVHEIMEVVGEAVGSERLREVNTSR